MSLNEKKPLEGIRVLSVETQVSAPFCTMMLADAGAEVIKIEAPGRGDVAREPGPILKNEQGEKISGYFMRFNRNKKSVTINLKEEAGKKVFEDLVAKSDVVIENLKPGALKSLGFDQSKLKSINPSVVHAAISGFGVSEDLAGPYSDRSAYDIIIQAMTGMMNLIGEENGPPLHPMLALGDVVPGIMTAYAIMLALYKKEKTGQGEFIDMAMFDVMMAVAERPLNVYSMTGNVMERGKESLIHPWGSFKTKDGYVAMIVLEQKMWKRFCDVIGKPELFEDERFTNSGLRAKNKTELDPLIKPWLESKTTEEVVELMTKAGLPVGPVRNAKDLYECPQAKARKMWVEVDDPVTSMKIVGNPIKMASQPVEERVKTVPRLGEHTDMILSEILGYTEAEIKSLKESGTV